jgi:hypothetical protein
LNAPPSAGAGTPSLPVAPPQSIWSVEAWVVAIWLAIQLGCLSLSLLHVPLAATFPPGERLAVELLLAGQIGSAALLAPVLFRRNGTAVVVIASAWPALFLAGALEVQPTLSTFLGAAIVTGWLETLWAWCAAFRSARSKAIVAAVATAVAVGGPLLAYLATEFGTPADADVAMPAGSAATPVLFAWHLTAEGFGPVLPGVLLLAVLLIGMTLAGRRASRDRRARFLRGEITI